MLKHRETEFANTQESIMDLFWFRAVITILLSLGIMISLASCGGARPSSINERDDQRLEEYKNSSNNKMSRNDAYTAKYQAEVEANIKALENKADEGISDDDGYYQGVITSDNRQYHFLYQFYIGSSMPMDSRPPDYEFTINGSEFIVFPELPLGTYVVKCTEYKGYKKKIWGYKRIVVENRKKYHYKGNKYHFGIAGHTGFSF